MKPWEMAVHEWIGRRVRIESASDPTHVGREGYVVDETLKTLRLEENGRKGRYITIPKKGSCFLFLNDVDRPAVEGDRVLFRPHERIKKVKSQEFKRRL